MSPGGRRLTTDTKGETHLSSHATGPAPSIITSFSYIEIEAEVWKADADYKRVELVRKVCSCENPENIKNLKISALASVC